MSTHFLPCFGVPPTHLRLRHGCSPYCQRPVLMALNKTRPYDHSPSSTPSPVQVYDDLGAAEVPRPPLGGSAQLPYPRHLANSRAEGAQGPGKPWLMFGQFRGAPASWVGMEVKWTSFAAGAAARKRRPC